MTTKTTQKIQLPKTIKVLNLTFRVTEDRKEFYAYSRESEEKDAYGYMDLRTQTIYVSPDQDDDCKIDALWHEVKHVLWALGGGGAIFDEDLEEKIILFQTSGEVAVLQNNPKLNECLMGRSNGSKTSRGVRSTGASVVN